MKSPFPGMDPYVEPHWGDFHTRMITFMSEMIRPQLPAQLRVRIEESVAVQEEGADIGQTYYPDVRVIERGGHGNGGGTAVAEATEVAEPLVIPIEKEMEPPTLRSLRIVDIHSGRRVVTAIELLSPRNKVGAAGRKAYRKKQQDLLKAGANVVEIDLIRGGKRVLAISEQVLPEECRAPYCIVVRAGPGRQFEFYAVSLRVRLPRFRVPLRPTDKDAILDLQALFERTYESGDYTDIDYRRPPRPPLRKADAAWADQWLRERAPR